MEVLDLRRRASSLERQNQIDLRLLLLRAKRRRRREREGGENRFGLEVMEFGLGRMR